MRGKKPELWCEQCGGTTISCCAEWIVFDRLTFCSPDCRAGYQLSMRRRHVKAVAVAPKSHPSKDVPARSRPSRLRGAA